MAIKSIPQLSAEADWNVVYIDGEWVSPDDAGTIPVENPHSRETLLEVPAVTTDTVDEAFDVAEQAQKEWANTLAAERVGVLNEVLELLHQYEDDIAQLITQETGGVPAKAGVEIHIAEGVLQDSFSMPARSNGVHDESIFPGRENIVQREPVGVVAGITPWNFPLNLTMRVIAPAIALGNSVVLKPDPQTPVIGGLLHARLFDEAGLPDGVLNVVTGQDEEIGDHISGHPTPNVMAFTGSTEIGRRVASRAAEQLTLPAMELGGNNPYIVLEDADLDLAVDAAVFGSFVHAGQVCISINRHLVHESLYDEYVQRLTERAESLPVGSLPDQTVVGPLINERQRDRVLQFIEDTVAAGATLETGGGHDELVVEPTVLSSVTNDMELACNEHFGPVAPVIPFSSDDEAVELANDTDMGLSAGIVSQDRGRARDMAERIEAGMVHINDQPINDEPHIPFGGVKASGMGRYNGDAIMRRFTETRWISIQHERRQYPF